MILKDITTKLKDNPELTIADDHALVIGMNRVDMTDSPAGKILDKE